MIEVRDGWAIYHNGELVFSVDSDKWQEIGPAIAKIMAPHWRRDEHFGTGGTACACGEVFASATLLGQHIARKVTPA